MKVAIFDAVPLGEANAETAHQIWRRVGLGAKGTVRLTLKALANEGVVERRLVEAAGLTAPTYFYWRDD